MIEIMETENKNKHYLLFHFLSQEGSTNDLQILCSLQEQLHCLTAHCSLPCFLLVSQVQHGRQMRHSAGSNLIQAPCFPRDAATRWVHRIETEGTQRFSTAHASQVWSHINCPVFL